MQNKRKATVRIKTITRLFFVVVMIGSFGYLFLFGQNNIQIYQRLKRNISSINGDLRALGQEISEINQEVVAWKHDDFMVEKMAREQLHMGRPGEMVYLISSQTDR